MAIFDQEKRLEAQAAQAEKELEEAVEIERPEELAPEEDDKSSKEADSEDTEAPEPTGDTAEDHDWKKRYGDLRRYMDKKLKPKYEKEITSLNEKLQKLEDSVEEISRKAAPSELPETEDDLNELKKENPAAYNALVSLAKGIAEEMVTSQTKELKATIAEVSKAQQKTAEEAAFIALQRKHPSLDLVAIAEGDDDNFNAWADQKSKRFLSPLYSQKEDVDAASDVLTAYEKETGVGVKTKSTKKGSTDASPKSGANVPDEDRGYDFTESQIERMSDKELSEKMEAIEKAETTGRILMDKSDPLGAQRRLGARAA